MEVALKIKHSLQEKKFKETKDKINIRINLKSYTKEKIYFTKEVRYTREKVSRIFNILI